MPPMTKAPILWELGGDDQTRTNNPQTNLSPSDFMIKCAAKEYKVARSNLSNVSSVFANLCKTENSVKLDDKESKIVSFMIDYINHGAYHTPDMIAGITALSDPSPSVRNVINAIEGRHEASNLHRSMKVTSLSAMVAHEKPNLWIHVELYNLAMRYNMVGLQSLCASNFRNLATKFKDSPELVRIVGLGPPFSLAMD